MSRQITIYLPSDGELSEIKDKIAALKADRATSYYGRSESAIAAMLLEERLDEIFEEKKAR
jgi:hypothetical protein